MACDRFLEECREVRRHIRMKSNVVVRQVIVYLHLPVDNLMMEQVRAPEQSPLMTGVRITR